MLSLALCQIAKALRYLHDAIPKVIHRDLKLENILMQGRVALAHTHCRLLLIVFYMLVCIIQVFAEPSASSAAAAVTACGLSIISSTKRDPINATVCDHRLAVCWLQCFFLPNACVRPDYDSTGIDTPDYFLLMFNRFMNQCITT